MRDIHFNELAGRIEGVGRLALHLAAALEDNGLIDGPRFGDSLRTAIQFGPGSPAHLATAAQILGELAAALDSARSWRQAQAVSGGNPEG